MIISKNSGNISKNSKLKVLFKIENQKKGGLNQMFEELVKEMKDLVIEDRIIKYENGEYGITELLQCPYKAELRRKYPEIRSEAPAIDDGFRFEYIVKNALKRKYGENFKEEVELPLKIGEIKIRGHLDCVIEEKDKITGIELKAPQIILLKKLPDEATKSQIIYDREGEDRILLVNPVYKIQAKIEKFVLKRLYPEKDVRLYLFQFGLCKMGTFLRKYYTCYEVDEISEEELAYLVADFLYNKGPRYHNECEYYCAYNYVCEEKERLQGKEKVALNIDAGGEVINIRFKEFLKYYRQYLELKDQLGSLKT